MPRHKTQSWLETWRSWLARLPLSDEPLEAELPAAAFGVGEPVKTPENAVRSASDRPGFPATADARRPAA